jgi:hypothetical protein
LIAQCLILALAGFPPQLYLAGLLYNLLLLSCSVILPLAAVATVTSNFARMTLTLLGISRSILIALPVLLLAALSFASRYDQARIDHIYSITQSAPIQLTFSPEARSFETASFQASAHAKIPIKIRLAESGVAEGFAVLSNALRVQIQAPDGSHWESEWQGGDDYKFLPGESHFSPSFLMPIEVYNSFQSLPLNVHLAIAITQAQAGKVSTVPMPLERVSVPDFGACWPLSWEPELADAMGVKCISALREPQLTYISTRWSDGPCAGSATAPDSGILGTGWVGSLNREPAQLSIAPTIDLPISLSNSEVVNTPGGKRRFLCVGTPITFTQNTRVGRMQTSVDVQGFRLPKIAVAGSMMTITQ